MSLSCHCQHWSLMCKCFFFWLFLGFPFYFFHFSQFMMGIYMDLFVFISLGFVEYHVCIGCFSPNVGDFCPFFLEGLSAPFSLFSFWYSEYMYDRVLDNATQSAFINLFCSTFQFSQFLWRSLFTSVHLSSAFSILLFIVSNAYIFNSDIVVLLFKISTWFIFLTCLSLLSYLICSCILSFFPNTTLNTYIYKNICVYIICVIYVCVYRYVVL